MSSMVKKKFFFFRQIARFSNLEDLDLETKTYVNLCPCMDPQNNYHPLGLPKSRENMTKYALLLHQRYYVAK